MVEMITVSGQTFAIRDILKALGGRWSAEEKGWQFYHLDPEAVAALRAVPGVSVRLPAPEPERAPTLIVGDDATYFNRFKDTDPIAFFGFSSMAAFADHVAGIPRPLDHDMASGWHTMADTIKWTGTADMAEALRLARDGWTDGLGLMQKFDIPAAIGKRREASVAGGRVNVGKMLTGNPVHMTHRRKQPHHRVITLFVDVQMWRGIKPLNAILRALIIGGMIDVLEAEDYRCELVAVATTIDFEGELKSQLAVQIKGSGDPLNMMDITFACGHPSFLRRLNFACEAGCGAFDRVGGLISECFETTGPNEFYIPQMMPMDQTRMSADPLSMLDFLEPEGLPVKIKDRL